MNSKCKKEFVFFLFSLFVLAITATLFRFWSKINFFNLGSKANLDIEILTDIEYLKTPTENLTLDICKDKRLAVKAPAVVFIHGGFWREDYGTKYGRKDRYRDDCVNIAKNGYVGVAINYRLVAPGKNPYPTQINDTQYAIRWLRSNSNLYKIDPNKIASWGESAGGYLAAMLGLRDTLDPSIGLSQFSSKVNLVIDEFGEMNLLNPYYYDPVQNPINYQLSVESIRNFLGGETYSPNNQKYREASPLTYVTSNAAPMFIAHGKNDKLVLPSESVEMQNKLKSFGVNAELFLFNGAHGISGRSNHGDISNEERQKVLNKQMTFLNVHFKKQWLGQILTEEGGQTRWMRYCPFDQTQTANWAGCTKWISHNVSEFVSPLKKIDSVSAEADYVYWNDTEQKLTQVIYSNNKIDGWFRNCPISMYQGVEWNRCEPWKWVNISLSISSIPTKLVSTTAYLFNSANDLQLIQKLIDDKSTEYSRICPYQNNNINWSGCSSWNTSKLIDTKYKFPELGSLVGIIGKGNIAYDTLNGNRKIIETIYEGNNEVVTSKGAIRNCEISTYSPLQGNEPQLNCGSWRLVSLAGSVSLKPNAKFIAKDEFTFYLYEGLTPTLQTGF